MAVSTIKSGAYPTKNATVNVSVSANNIDTKTLSVSDAKYHIVKGFAVMSSTSVIPMQIYFSDDNTITVRVRNVASSTQTATVAIYYC